MNNVMLDLETMGTGPSAAIIAIGAIEFDPESTTLGRTFYQNVNLVSSVAHGGVMDADTVMWWLQQSEAARYALTNKHNTAISIGSALIEFGQWLNHFSSNCIGADYKVVDTKLWGNGSDFDNVVLRSAYERTGLIVPWNFRNNRCYRTLKNLFPDKKLLPPQEGTQHNALDDARWQAQHALNIFTSLKEQA